MAKGSGPPSPRPPAITTRASSSLAPVAASAWRSSTRTPRSSSGISTATGTTVALPPDGSASTACGRTSTIVGSGPSNATSTIFVPPKISVLARSVARTSVALLMSVEPVRACSRPATSRASYVLANSTIEGRYSSTSAASTCAVGRPGCSKNTSSSLANSVPAPCAPRSSAAAVAPGPSATASTRSPRERAAVSSSDAEGCTPSDETCAYTQTRAN